MKKAQGGTMEVEHGDDGWWMLLFLFAPIILTLVLLWLTR